MNSVMSAEEETAELAVIIGAYLLLLHHGEAGPFGAVRVVERTEDAEVVWEFETG